METPETSTVHFDTAAAVALTIETYRPKSLSGTQAAQALPRLRDLVRGVEPRTTIDAGCLLSSACCYVAEMAESEGVDVDALLTEEGVSRWSYAWRQSGRSDGTLANHLGRLNRLLRAKAGHAPISSRRAELTTSRPPYPLEALTSFAGGLAATDPAAAAAVVAGAAAGVVVPEVSGSTFRQLNGGGVVITVDGVAHVVVGAWREIALGLLDISVDGDAWARARAAAAPDLGCLDSRRLRTTWTNTVLSEPRPLAEVLRNTQWGRRTLDAARPHLPVMSGAVVAGLLRG